MSGTSSLLSWPDKSLWQPDEMASKCFICNVGFNLTTRRHHCRGCGLIFCSKCSDFKLAHPNDGNRPVRACSSCYNLVITSTSYNYQTTHFAYQDPPEGSHIREFDPDE